MKRKMHNSIATRETVLIDYDEILVEKATLRATLFSINGSEVWIPNSCIEEIWEDSEEVEVHRWFAEKEGLI